MKCPPGIVLVVGCSSSASTILHMQLHSPLGLIKLWSPGPQCLPVPDCAMLLILLSCCAWSILLSICPRCKVQTIASAACFRFPRLGDVRGAKGLDPLSTSSRNRGLGFLCFSRIPITVVSYQK
ncbi:hypothetical protein B0T25DRAFT_344330 [Lasiosphaeria hispida]|uniref:Uncharacterized protein n=1 Tax=Lasiosphaeria hispida TaxID=260671 RepID=A0AAJ0H760_9PEZI|nr:hypothetical protein B0T25DRAFT_344330 [Lasiosphaeria hispida]